MKRSFRNSIACKLLWGLLLIPYSIGAQQTRIVTGVNGDKLFDGFITPPDEAKPRTWWHWTGSNVTKEGITKDLEWMKRVGIGGFMMFDVSMGSGQSVDKKLIVFTPEWYDALRHAAAEADRLGLEMTMHSSAGWSETGGPWVKPEEAIKKVVWSELQVKGPGKLSEQLPDPPSVNGPIRDLSGSRGTPLNSETILYKTLYADSKVIAYRTPPAETQMKDFSPIVTSNIGVIDAAPLMDDDLTTKVNLPVPVAGNPTWIQFEFEKPYTALTFSLALAPTGSYGSSSMRPGYVKISDDGINFQTIITLPGAQHDIRAIPVRTFSISETSARFYRVEFMPGSGITTVGGPDDRQRFSTSDPSKTFDVLEAKFITGGRVNRWEDKANFAAMFAFETLVTPTVNSIVTIKSSDIIDLTSKMSPDGHLTWDIPVGNWTIMRFGYSLTGSTNGPAIPEGTGYEVDKLNGSHMESYYKGFTSGIKEALGPLYGKSLQYFLVDSYEANAQNWTDDMIPEFKKRRGYDPIPYLPVLAGRIVESSEVSDRFLWDFRRTIADLLAEEHYETITKLAHNQGIKIYSESAGISLPIIQDALLNKSKVDIPMGEFGMTQGLSGGEKWMAPLDIESVHSWNGANDRMNAHQSDVREAASASHIYGKPIVAAESWTGGGYEAPSSLKLIGDYWNTQGVNRFIFHTSAHQPLDTKPGNTMVGAHINRNITWAEQATPFMVYLARNSFMLQQGKFVADIVYYLGEGIPSAVPYWEKLKPELPAGYDYDCINTEILLESAFVENGMIVLKSGMKYRVLVLPETNEMTPHVLKKVKELVENGATIIGPKPIKSSGLAGYPSVDTEIASLANEIWGGIDGRLIYKNAYGKGKVYWGIPIEGILVDLKVAKDLDYTRPNTNTYLSWIHRKTDNADIYFITNMRNQSENLSITLRSEGKIPELWHSDTGTREQLSYNIEDGLTTIALKMDPEESVFVVLIEPVQNHQRQLPDLISTKLTEISGSWILSFPPNLGAPATISLENLQSWTEHSNEGVKYFSGTVTYSKEIVATKAWFRPGVKYILDLGEVRDIAEVTINGKSLGILWKPPYKLEVTGLLKKGANKIEIKVTNQWNNRIAGDRTLQTEKKILSNTGGGFSSGGASSPLQKSGLIGPVNILIEQ